jgi:hypothetical protein
LGVFSSKIGAGQRFIAKIKKSKPGLEITGSGLSKHIQGVAFEKFVKVERLFLHLPGYFPCDLLDCLAGWGFLLF